MLPEPPDTAWLTRFRRSLIRWYREHGRELPWRQTGDPYPIWISEVMLQQTTVAAVIPYYERFLKAFPTVEALADADEQHVLRLWEGLGYYSRARNLHKAAQTIVAKFDARFPESVADLQSLPGVGRYTAGAIASFAFDIRAPIVEANTLRLYCRLLNYSGDPRSREGQELLWDFATRVLPRREPGRFNQALMELGGTLCAAQGPECQACPVRSLCQAAAAGSQQDVPRRPTRPRVTELVEANVVVRKAGLVLIRRHAAGERWEGLWDFPRYPVSATDQPVQSDENVPAAVRRDLAEKLHSETGIQATLQRQLTELRHSVTRYRIQLLCFEASFDSGRLKRGQEIRWVRPNQLTDYPLSVTARKIARLVCTSD